MREHRAVVAEESVEDGDAADDDDGKAHTPPGGFEDEENAEDRDEVVEVRIAEDLDGVAHQPRVLDEDVEIAAESGEAEEHVVPGDAASAPDQRVGDAVACRRRIEEATARRVEEEDERGGAREMQRGVHPRVEGPFEGGIEVVDGEGDGQSADHPDPPAEILAIAAGGVMLCEYVGRCAFSGGHLIGAGPGRRGGRPGRCRIFAHGSSMPSSSKYF